MRVLLAGLVMVAGLGIAACGGNAGPHVNTTSNTDHVFVTTVRDNVSESQGTSDADIIALGHSICGSLNSGASLLSVVNVGINSGFSPGDAGFMVGASIAAYCPQHKQEVYQLQQDLQ